MVPDGALPPSFTAEPRASGRQLHRLSLHDVATHLSYRPWLHYSRWVCAGSAIHNGRLLRPSVEAVTNLLLLLLLLIVALVILVLEAG